MSVVTRENMSGKGWCSINAWMHEGVKTIPMAIASGACIFIKSHFHPLNWHTTYDWTFLLCSSSKGRRYCSHGSNMLSRFILLCRTQASFPAVDKVLAGWFCLSRQQLIASSWTPNESVHWLSGSCLDETKQKRSYFKILLQVWVCVCVHSLLL